MKRLINAACLNLGLLAVLGLTAGCGSDSAHQDGTPPAASKTNQSPEARDSKTQQPAPTLTRTAAIEESSPKRGETVDVGEVPGDPPKNDPDADKPKVEPGADKPKVEPVAKKSNAE